MNGSIELSTRCPLTAGVHEQSHPARAMLGRDPKVELSRHSLKVPHQLLTVPKVSSNRRGNSCIVYLGRLCLFPCARLLN